jgi:uncharacterized protein (DUF4415 family)
VVLKKDTRPSALSEESPSSSSGRDEQEQYASSPPALQTGVSEGRLVRRSSEELRSGRTDWERLKNLTDEEIDAGIAADPDAAPIADESWFREAEWGNPLKVATSIRVDGDVIDWFRSQGKGWQTRMNAVLRTYARAHGGVK